MPTLVVNDVTIADSRYGTVKKSAPSARSTITPFQKVLDKEEKKVSAERDDGEFSISPTDSGVKRGSGVPSDSSLASVFSQAAEKYDISYDFLVAVAKAESNFHTKSVSSAGAQGIMQLMPATSRELGVKDPFDEKESIMAAARLLKAHLDKFGGDYTLAAAAYNAGGGAVTKYGGVPPYSETQHYVKKIKKYMQEGVTVPDRKAVVSSGEASEGSGGSTDVEFDRGVDAGAKDWEQVTVSVGTGDAAVTMSYGAYLKYLELGTTGVG